MLRLDERVVRPECRDDLFLPRRDRRQRHQVPLARACAQADRDIRVHIGIPAARIEINPLVAQTDRLRLVLVFHDQPKDAAKHALEAAFSHRAGDQLDSRNAAFRYQLRGRCRLVLQCVRIKPRRRIAHARSVLQHRVQILQHGEGLFRHERHVERRDRSTRINAGLDADGLSKLRLQHRVGIAHRALLDNRLKVVLPIEIVECLARQHRLDALDILDIVEQASAFPSMRDNLRRDVRKRIFADRLIGQDGVVTAPARHADAAKLGDPVAVIVNTALNLEILDTLRRLVANVQTMPPAAPVRIACVVLFLGDSRKGRDGVHLLAIIPHRDQIRPRFRPAAMDDELRILNRGGVRIDAEFLRRHRHDGQGALRHRALDLDRVQHRARHEHGREFARQRLAGVLQDLNARIGRQLRESLVRQPRMRGKLDPLRRLPPMLDDAIAQQQRVVHRAPHHAIAIAAAQEHVIHVIRRLLGRVLVLAPLRLEFHHAIRGHEGAHERRHDLADSRPHVARHSLRPFGIRWRVSHLAAIILKRAGTMLARAIRLNRRNHAVNERCKLAVVHLGHLGCFQ